MEINSKIKYTFSAEVWRHSSPDGWYFVSLPKKLATEIRDHLKWQEESWGRLKVVAKISAAEWETAIWFDTKLDTYLRPLKAEIRKREQLETGGVCVLYFDFKVPSCSELPIRNACRNLRFQKSKNGSASHFTSPPS